MDKPIPKTESGRVIALVTLDVPESKMDKLVSLLEPVKKHALSDAEPKTLTYRLARSDTQVVVFEEYADEEGLRAHESQDALPELLRVGSVLQSPRSPRLQSDH